MEFQVTTDLQTIQPRSIQSNVKEVHAWLDTNLERYRQMIVEEGEIQNAKADLAQIRKIQKTISDQRIQVKKEFLEPYTKWEAEVKELEGLCQEAINNIDTQVKRFDEQRRAEKRDKLVEYFDSLVSASKLDDCVDFTQIENPKWMNVSYTLEECMKEIKTLVSETYEDVRTIYNQNSEFETALLEEYKQSHDLRKTLAKDQYLRGLKEREAIRRNQISPQPIDGENHRSGLRENDENLKSEQNTAAVKKEKMYDVLLHVQMTAKQMWKLSAWFEEENVSVIQSKHKEVR